jgi:hypothetical protein
LETAEHLPSQGFRLDRALARDLLDHRAELRLVRGLLGRVLRRSHAGQRDEDDERQGRNDVTVAHMASLVPAV